MSKGKKICSECKRSVGVRTKVCPCGYEFGKSVVRVIEKKDDVTPIVDPFLIKYITGLGRIQRAVVVYAIAGKPQLILTSYDEDSVFEYCDRCITYGVKDGRLFMPSVIKSWIRNSVPDSEQSKVLKSVDSWVNSIIEENSNEVIE